MSATTDPRPVDMVIAAIRAAGPVTAAELAKELGLHVTTARFHLDRLEAAGEVVSVPARPGARGRPARRYRALDVSDARTRMIEALAEAIDGEGAPGDRAERAGERWGESVELPDGDPAEAVTAVLAEMGFAPQRDTELVRLRACPFLAAARRNPEVVCAVHLGLARRVARRAGSEAEVSLEPFVAGGCRLALGV